MLVGQVTCVRHAAHGAVEVSHRSPRQMGHTQLEVRCILARDVIRVILSRERIVMHYSGLTRPYLARPFAWLIAALLALAPQAILLPHAGAAPRDQVADDGHYAPLSALPADKVGHRALSAVISAGDCNYQQANDNAHFSSTGFAISSHGWWVMWSGTCPNTANVDIYLQAVYCDSNGCRWRTVDTDSATVRDGGGAGKRATAREECSGVTTVGWRSYVDVDLVGVSDPSGYTYSEPQDRNCYPIS